MTEEDLHKLEAKIRKAACLPSEDTHEHGVDVFFRAARFRVTIYSKTKLDISGDDLPRIAKILGTQWARIEDYRYDPGYGDAGYARRYTYYIEAGGGWRDGRPRRWLLL